MRRILKQSSEENGMTVSIISFTEKGEALSKKLQQELTFCRVKLFTKYQVVNRQDGEPDILQLPEETSVTEWAKEQLQAGHGMIFIGATGIAVRAIAPWIKDKLTDGPVLVVDETGLFVIPLLSGHVGGANELAQQIAEITGGIPVITTATDVNGKAAIDVWAKKQGLTIRNKDGIKRVAAKILRDEEVTVYIDKKELDILVSNDPTRQEDAALFLTPKEYVIGIGCRRGKSEQELTEFIEKHLTALSISTEEIWRIASIDRKKEEAGIIGWAEKNRVPFVTFSEEALRRVTGEFHGSSFVEQTVGVDNVCERAALLACTEGGRLVLEKQAENGMTIAVAKRNWSVNINEA
jgi:cobalt-precorrin 5A hydrolase